jgi:hypothetical protein
MTYYWDNEQVDISSFIGLIFTSITSNRDEIGFVTNTGDKYQMYHNQDCCESVIVEDIVGDLNDLIGTPILVAEERTRSSDEHTAGLLRDDAYDDCEQWTFYELRTIKGSVTIRWYGSSNGYYGVGVDIQKIR